MAAALVLGSGRFSRGGWGWNDPGGMLAKVVDALPISLSLKDRNGRFILVNREFCRRFGVSREEALGLTTAGINRNAQAAARLEEKERVLKEGGGGKAVLEMEYTRADGRSGWTSVIKIPLHDAPGEAPMILGVSMDITERKAAEDALRESENKFRILAETSAGAIFIIQGERFIYMNEAGFRLTGRNWRELREMDFWQVVHPEHQEMVRQRGLARQRGESPPSRYEFKLLNPGTGVRWVDFTASYIDFQGRPAMLGTCFDITQRKEAQAALAASEEKYRNILESMVEGYYEADLSGNLTFANDAVCRMLGYRRADLLKLNNRDLMDGQTAREVYAAFNQVYRGRLGGRSLEWRFVTRDGRERSLELSIYLVMDAGGNPTGFRGLARDITFRREAERRLKESEEKYRALLEANPDPVVVYDMEGRVQYFNPAFEQVFGWFLEEKLGRTMEDFVTPECLPKTRQMIEVLKGGARLSGQEGRRLTRDGRIIPVSISAALFRDRDGVPRGSVVNIRDVSRQKRMEEQLAQSSKMEAVGTLASGIAHDFNNILQTVAGYVQLLLWKDTEGPRARSHLLEIDRAVDRAGDLVQHLLTFGRKVEPRMTPVDLNREVAGAAKVLRHTIPKMIDIEMDLEDGPLALNADPSQLGQVLLNLGSNARDAMPEGGVLSFTTRRLPAREVRDRGVMGLDTRDYVVLTVADNGRGMDRETLRQAFEPFFTTKEVGRGTGLGLSLVYGVVKGHQGHVVCRSSPGEGTSFTIYLPALEKPFELLEAGENRSGAPPRTRQGGESVLMVDDEGPILEAGRELLEAQGFRVFTAGSGERALEMIRERPGEMDLIIMDLGMPGMGGLRCLEEIRRLEPGVAVVVASGYTLDQVLKEDLARFSAGYIHKPYRMADLLEMVREGLEGEAAKGKSG